MKVPKPFRRCAAAAVLLLASVSAAEAAPCSPDHNDTQLQVEVRNVRSARGLVTVTAYPDEPRRFLAPRGKVERVREKAIAPVTIVCLEVPAPGVYALAVYHDENGDKDFNRTRVGLPAEGYGFSNDAPTAAGLPSFNAVRFRAKGPIHRMSLRMRYGR